MGSVAEMIIYESISLNPADRDIRLLHLQPGQDGDPVEGYLVGASLDSKPAYHVLSYAWGSENDHVSIKLRGEEFQVTKNLQWGTKSSN